MGRASARMSGAWVRMGVPSGPMGVPGLRMRDASVRMEALRAPTGDASGADERRGGADGGDCGLSIVDFGLSIGGRAAGATIERWLE